MMVDIVHMNRSVRQVQRKREQARQSGKKRKIYYRERECDWSLRRTSVLLSDGVPTNEKFSKGMVT